MARRKPGKGAASEAARGHRLRNTQTESENRSRINGSGCRTIASSGDSRHPTAESRFKDAATFTSNVAEATPHYGHAIYNMGTITFEKNVTFTANSTDSTTFSTVYNVGTINFAKTMTLSTSTDGFNNNIYYSPGYLDLKGTLNWDLSEATDVEESAKVVGWQYLYNDDNEGAKLAITVDAEEQLTGSYVIAEGATTATTQSFTLKNNADATTATITVGGDAVEYKGLSYTLTQNTTAGTITLTVETAAKKVIVTSETGTEASPYDLGSGKTYTIPTSGTNGGAVEIQEDAYATGEALTFSGNNASCGGAVYVTKGHLVFTDDDTADKIAFEKNSASGAGGALYVEGEDAKRSTVTFRDDVAFTENTVSGHSGGALYNRDSDVVFENTVIFSDNRVDQYLGSRTTGGAVENGGSGTITFKDDVTFSGNKTTGTTGNTGGAINNQATVTFAKKMTLSTETDTIVNTGTLNWDVSAGTDSSAHLSHFNRLENAAFDGELAFAVAAVSGAQALGSYTVASKVGTLDRSNSSFLVTGGANDTRGLAFSFGCTPVVYNGRAYTIANDTIEEALVLTVAEIPAAGTYKFMVDSGMGASAESSYDLNQAASAGGSISGITGIREGAAVISKDAFASATNLTISGNTIANGNFIDAYGAGLTNYGGTVAFNGSGSGEGNKTVFSGNILTADGRDDVTAYGGALANVGGALSFNNAVDFSSNTATGSNANGGALYVEGGSAVFHDTASFAGNSATTSEGSAYGGAIMNSYGEIQFLGNATFTGNTASSLGGAIANMGTITFAKALTLTNDTDTLVNLGTLNWDLSSGDPETAGSYAVLNGYDKLINSLEEGEASTLTITVSAAHTAGSYVIATGDVTDTTDKDTFTLTGVTGKDDVSITIDGRVVGYNGLGYSLVRDTTAKTLTLKNVEVDTSTLYVNAAWTSETELAEGLVWGVNAFGTAETLSSGIMTDTTKIIAYGNADELGALTINQDLTIETADAETNAATFTTISVASGKTVAVATDSNLASTGTITNGGTITLEDSSISAQWIKNEGMLVIKGDGNTFAIMDKAGISNDIGTIEFSGSSTDLTKDEPRVTWKSKLGVNTGTLSLTNGSTITVGDFISNISVDNTSALTAGSVTIGNGQTISLALNTASPSVTVTGAVAVTGTGSITVDMTGATADSYTLIGAGAASDYGTNFTVTGSAYTLSQSGNNLIATKGAVASVTVGGVTTYYSTLKEAADKISTSGDTTVKILDNHVVEDNIEYTYGASGTVTFTADKAVTISQTSFGEPGAQRCFDFFQENSTANIVVDRNVTFELYGNSNDFNVWYGANLQLDGTITGGDDYGALYFYQGDHVVSSTGTIGTGRVHSRRDTLTVNGSDTVQDRYEDMALADRSDAQVNTNHLFIVSGTFTANDTYVKVSPGTAADGHGIYDTNKGVVQDSGVAAELNFNRTKLDAYMIALTKMTTKFDLDESIATITDGVSSSGTFSLTGSTLSAASFTNAGTVEMDCTSSITVSGAFIGTSGCITVDMTGADKSVYRLVDAAATSSYGEAGTNYKFVTGKDNGYTLTVKNNDLYAVKTLTDVLVNSDYAAIYTSGDPIIGQPGYFYGINAFGEIPADASQVTKLEITGGVTVIRNDVTLASDATIVVDEGATLNLLNGAIDGVEHLGGAGTIVLGKGVDDDQMAIMEAMKLDGATVRLMRASVEKTDIPTEEIGSKKYYNVITSEQKASKESTPEDPKVITADISLNDTDDVDGIILKTDDGKDLVIAGAVNNADTVKDLKLEKTDISNLIVEGDVKGFNDVLLTNMGDGVDQVGIKTEVKSVIAAENDLTIVNADSTEDTKQFVTELGVQTHTAKNDVTINNGAESKVIGTTAVVEGEEVEVAANLKADNDVNIINDGHMNANVTAAAKMTITNGSANTLIGDYAGAVVDVTNTATGAAKDVTLKATVSTVTVTGAAGSYFAGDTVIDAQIGIVLNGENTFKDGTLEVKTVTGDIDTTDTSATVNLSDVDARFSTELGSKLAVNVSGESSISKWDDAVSPAVINGLVTLQDGAVLGAGTNVKFSKILTPSMEGTATFKDGAKVEHAGDYDVNGEIDKEITLNVEKATLTATGVNVQEFGTINLTAAIINATGGKLFVQDGTINVKAGTTTVTGTASNGDVLVSENGELNLEKGAVLAANGKTKLVYNYDGTINLKGGTFASDVAIKNEKTLNWDLTVGEGNESTLADWSRLTNTGTLSITVDGAATTDASYTLAGNATGATDTFTLKGFGTTTPTITVGGEAVDYGSLEYSLAVKEGDLVLTAAQRAITITATNQSKTYDGTMDVDQTKYTFTEGILQAGDTLSVVLKVDGVLGGTISVDSYKVMRGATDVTSEYKFAASEDATLTVNAIATPITITANSASKAYDGTALTDAGFTFTEGVLVEGDVLTATVEGSVTNAGAAENDVTSYKVMRGGTDVSAGYTFGESVKGMLLVSPRKITLTSADDAMVADGTELRNEKVTVSDGSFVGTEGFTYGDFKGLTDVGSIDNFFTATAKAGTNAFNYDLTKVYGTLTVTDPDDTYVIEGFEKTVEKSTEVAEVVVRSTVDKAGKLVLTKGSTLATDMLVLDGGTLDVTAGDAAIGGLVVSANASTSEIKGSVGKLADTASVLVEAGATLALDKDQFDTFLGWRLFVSNGDLSVVPSKGNPLTQNDINALVTLNTVRSVDYVDQDLTGLSRVTFKSNNNLSIGYDNAYGTLKGDVITLKANAAIELGTATSRTDLGAGSDRVSVGSNALFVLNGTLANTETVSISAGSKQRVGKDKVQRYTNVALDAVEGTRRFTAGSYTDVTVGLFAGTEKNDKITFGNHTDVDLGAVTFGAGNDTLKIGVYSDVTAKSLDFGAGSDTLSIGARSDVEIAGAITGVRTLSLASGKATTDKETKITTVAYTTLKAGDVALTEFADKITLGNYTDVDLGAVTFGAGNDTLKIGTYSDVTAKSLDFGDGKDTLSIGKGSTLTAETLDVNDLEKLSIGKDGTLYLGADSFAAAQTRAETDARWKKYFDNGQIAQIA